LREAFYLTNPLLQPSASPPLQYSMRFTRYPRWELHEITPRKLVAVRRTVQKEKDRYPLFTELLNYQTAEERLAAIIGDGEQR
jgi:hypothetical protein